MGGAPWTLSSSTKFDVLLIISKRIRCPGVNCSGREPHLEAQVPANVVLGWSIDTTKTVAATKAKGSFLNILSSINNFGWRSPRQFNKFSAFSDNTYAE